MRDGEISLAAAEALTLGNAEQQRAAIARLDSGYRYDADDIRDWLTGEKPALSLAIFPLERYEGTTTSDLFAEEDATVFDDAEQFLRLQTEAVEALAAHHREAGAAFVDILTENYAAWWQYREADTEAGEEGGVAIHFKPSGRVEVRQGLARREVRPSVAEDTADHPAAPKEKPEYTGAVIRMVAAHKSLAVMAGLLANSRKAREVAVVTMLNACDWTARARLDAHPALAYFAGEDAQPDTYAKVEGAAQPPAHNAASLPSGGGAVSRCARDAIWPEAVRGRRPIGRASDEGGRGRQRVLPLFGADQPPNCVLSSHGHI